MHATGIAFNHSQAKHGVAQPSTDHFYPEVGIGAVVAGTILAIALVPQTDAGGENSVLPAMAMSVGLMTAPILAAHQGTQVVTATRAHRTSLTGVLAVA